LKDTETQLVQSEKLASLGRMSAGIIHEINNPLNFVKNGLYTLRGKEAFLDEAQKPDFHEILRDVEDGINRVRNIVSDLRTFTHPDASVGDEIEVGECVTLALRLLSNEWKDQVVIEKSISAGQTVWGNRNKLVQVLVNLLQNSFDALKTKAFAGEKPTVWIEAHIAEGKREVRVRDNGPGIAPEHQDRIFEPFFTTKDVGQGMGLGLSICYRIMQEFQGRISVRSQPGEFTQFILEFPDKMAAYNNANTIN
jgi:C4-dicarboxylate-specific signal transduction histidine kinase